MAHGPASNSTETAAVKHGGERILRSALFRKQIVRGALLPWCLSRQLIRPQQRSQAMLLEVCLLVVYVSPFKGDFVAL
ncbi:hypothetical protein SRHO_G00007360 [Serrasalmus rhombeus]